MVLRSRLRPLTPTLSPAGKREAVKAAATASFLPRGGEGQGEGT
jgi:hypothetical protein